MEHVDALPKGEPPREPGKIVKASPQALTVARRVTLVTGASAGLEIHFARQCRERGDELVLVARRRDRLEALAAELGSAHVVAADLAEPGAPGAAARGGGRARPGGRHSDQQCRLRLAGAFVEAPAGGCSG